MYMTTLTAFVAFFAMLTLIVTRPNANVRDASSRQTRRAASCVSPRPAPTEQFPRLSRNRWARQDLARTLMTDDDYTGRISPHARPHRDTNG